MTSAALYTMAKDFDTAIQNGSMNDLRAAARGLNIYDSSMRTKAALIKALTDYLARLVKATHDGEQAAQAAAKAQAQTSAQAAQAAQKATSAGALARKVNKRGGAMTLAQAAQAQAQAGKAAAQAAAKAQAAQAQARRDANKRTAQAGGLAPDTSAQAQDAPAQAAPRKYGVLDKEYYLAYDCKRKVYTVAITLESLETDKDGNSAIVAQAHRKTFAIPKVVFEDKRTEYAHLVCAAYFNERTAQAAALVAALKDKDEVDVERVNVAESNLSILTRAASVFASAHDIPLAKAQGLYLAGGVLDVLTGALRDDCESLYKAFEKFNLDGLKSGRAQYTSVEVDNFNSFRDALTKALAPYSRKSDFNHKVKTSCNEDNLFSWLCWARGKDEKYAFRNKAGLKKFDKCLIEFFMLKVFRDKAKDAPATTK